MSESVTAADMARALGIDDKRFRQALRDANLAWHTHDELWKVKRGSPEHKDMQAVLGKLFCKRRKADQT